MTIAGFHTSEELADLTKSYDYQEGQFAGAVQSATADGSWASADPAGWGQFTTDWTAWKAAYDPVRADVQQYVGLSDVIDAAALPAIDHAYTKLAAAFLPMIDLDRRMRAGPATSFAPSYKDNPQPVAPDTDLNVFNGIGAAQNALTPNLPGLPGLPGLGLGWVIGLSAGGALLAVVLLKRLL